MDKPWVHHLSGTIVAMYYVKVDAIENVCAAG